LTGLRWGQFSAWTTANAFLPEAISTTVYRVAQYLGLKLGLQIDQSVVTPIPNIEPPPPLQANRSDIASGKNALAFNKDERNTKLVYV
jgi:hypothetical protein